MRLSRLLVFALVALFLASATIAVAQQGQQGQQGQAGDRGQGGMRGEEMKEKMHAMHVAARNQAERDERALERLDRGKLDQGFERAGRNNLFARFNESGENVTGRFVSFQFGTDHLRSFQVSNGTSNLTIFTNVAFPGAGTPTYGPKATGAVWRMVSDNVSVSVHNNPTAHLNLMPGANYSGEVTFTLAGGSNVTNASQEDLDQNGLRVNYNGNHYHIVPHGNATLNATGGVVRVNLTDGGVSVVFHPLTAGLRGSTLHDLNRLIATGKAGAVANVVNVDGVALADVTSLGVEVEATEVEIGSATFTVASDDPASKVVVFNLDPSVLNTTELGDIEVLMDGQRITVNPASGSAALDAVANATAATAAVALAPEGGAQVWVNVPSFSEHEITVQEAAEGGNGGDTTNGGGIPGFEVAALIGALGAALLVLRRR